VIRSRKFNGSHLESEEEEIMKALAKVAVAALLLSATVLAAPTATLTLTSPQNGGTVQAGATVSWSIFVGVSTGDNAGLALVCVDLAQDAANPAKFDIPYADGVPAAMASFSRPLGISNPGEGGNPTGYVGVQRGGSNQKNLIQLGGAQNTFGAPGGSIGTDFTPEGGIGQGAQPQLVASGSFTAPSVAGVYTFRLQNPLVNVITTLNSPPAFSPVQAVATNDINIAGGVISFTVTSGPAICPGDADCDGDVDFDDIDLFVAALSGEAAWAAQYFDLFGTQPPCSYLNNDADGNSSVDFDDIDSFVASIGSVCP